MTTDTSTKAILTVGALRDLLDQLTEQGIDQDTAVVVADRNGWYDEIETSVLHPLDRSEGEYIWVTLNPAGPADARFTSGHYDDDDTVVVKRPAQIVGEALARFWQDDSLSHRASDYDAMLYAARALEIEGHRWSDAAVRRAADSSFVMVGYGVDQATDEQYHAVMASILLETEDV